MKLNLFFLRLKKLLLILSSARLLSCLIQRGVFAGVEHRALLNESLKTIIDIGANKGQFALAVRKWAKNARIISFEPLCGPSKIFKAVFKNDANVHLNIAAIGPTSQRSLMHLSEHEDSSSLLPIGPKQSIYFPGTHEKGVVEIDVAPLDSFLHADDIELPSMLKLDVQGFEMEALKGCESLFTRINLIYCECSFIELYSDQKLAHDIIQWLYDRQFILIGVFNTSYDFSGQAIQADFLFERQVL